MHQRWVLVGYAQPRSSMLLTLLIALPLQIVFDGRCNSPWFTALAIHIPDCRSHDEPHRLHFRRGQCNSWPRCSLHSSCLGSTVHSPASRARRHPVALPRPTKLHCQADLPQRLSQITPYIQQTLYRLQCALRGSLIRVSRDFAMLSCLALQH